MGLNDQVVTRKLLLAATEHSFPFFFQELATAAEVCLADDLDETDPFKDFMSRIDNAFQESSKLLSELTF